MKIKTHVRTRNWDFPTNFLLKILIYEHYRNNQNSFIYDGISVLRSRL